MTLFSIIIFHTASMGFIAYAIEIGNGVGVAEVVEVEAVSEDG